MKQPIKKAVFPLAGFGTRFLPATKASPKEMLPIVDKPLIQYAVEETIRIGITDMIFITSSSKRAIANHFDRNSKLEMHLQAKGDKNLLELIKNISPKGIQFFYVEQEEPLGLGHAVLCAEKLIDNDPFIVLLADDLIEDSCIPCLSGMIEHFKQDGQSIVAVQQAALEDLHKYGVVSVVDSKFDYSQITEIQEKPTEITPISDLIAIGRYIFTSSIFACLKQTKFDSHGELQLSDAIQLLVSQQKAYAYHFHGKRYDCGSKLGYLQAMVEFALCHEELSGNFKAYLQNLQYGPV